MTTQIKTTAEMLELHAKERLRYLNERLTEITQNKSDYLDVNDVTSFLNISENTLVNWTRTGSLIKHEIKGKPIYNRADIINLADKVYIDGKMKRLILD